MKKVFFVSVCLLFVHTFMYGEESAYENNTQTVYADKIYTTTSTTKINATQQNADKVIDKFIYDLTTQPESLFDNILEGLGSQGEGKDIFLIEYKGYNYDKTTGLYTGTLDIMTNNERKLAGVDFTGKITRTKNGNSSIAVFELINTNPVVKLAKGSLTINKTGNNTIEIFQEANFKFSWFFNIFFSMKNYKSVAEWRLDKFLQNIKREILLLE